MNNLKAYMPWLRLARRFHKMKAEEQWVWYYLFLYAEAEQA